MGRANVNDRHSLECIYPVEAFARDAAQTERPTTELLHGVLVASAPDASGGFALSRTTRHIGEPPSPDFLAPFRQPAPDPGAHPDPAEQRSHAAFLDQIIETAQRHGYRPEESPGRGDARIRGLRQ